MNTTNTSNLHLPIETNIDFRGLIHSFWENKKIILIITFSIVAIALTYTLLKQPEYDTNILIQVANKNSNNFNLFQNLGVNSNKTDDTAAQIALIKSRFILEPVIRNLGLAIDIKPENSLLDNIFNHGQSLIINNVVMPSSYYNQILKLKIIDKFHYSLIDSHDRVLIEGELGKTVTNKQTGISLKVISANLKPNSQFKIVKHSDLSIVNRLIPQLRVEELGEINSKTGILQISLKSPYPEKSIRILNAIAYLIQEKDIEQKSLEAEKTLNFLEKQLPIAKSSLEKAELAYNNYRATTGKLDIKLETQTLMTQLINIGKEITSATLNKINLLQNYTSKHPFILEINDKIVQLNNEKIQLEKRLKTLPATDQIMVNLMRDVEVKNKLYLVLLSQIQEFRINKAGTASDIRILSFATLPDAPLSKQIPIVTVVSTVLGLILGCLVVLAKKSFFRRINDPRWMEQHLNLMNLAIVPYCKQQEKNMRAFKNKEKKYLDILAEKYPNDLSLEALRSLRTSFQIMLAGATNNIVVFTGISPATGKSFLAANFSALLAEAGKRILLIDGDIRKGYLHSYFKTNRSPGLTEILLEKNSLEECLRVTSFGSLSFLTTGSLPNNPSELLMTENLKKLMKEVSGKFDLVIIDTAPVLAATDSSIIGVLAGVNLLVVGSDSHQAEEIHLAIKRLEHSAVKIQGTIFNHLKPESKSYGNYQYNYQQEPLL